MMKKIFAVLLALTMLLSLAACGNKGGEEEKAEAPDLQTYYDDLMASFGDEAPMMQELSGEFLESAYPGLSEYTLNQQVIYMAMISAVAFELALVEVADPADVDGVKEIFQARIDSQIAGGAMYPVTIEAWENAEIITNGNVVALIVAGDSQAEAVDAFNALFA